MWTVKVVESGEHKKLRGLSSLSAWIPTLVSLFTGCATLTRPARVHPLKPNAPYLTDYHASRRGAILLQRPDGKGMMYCAEPSPDVAYNSVLSLVASVQVQNPNVDASTQLNFQQSVVELAQRAETIQFLREALYRLCEQTINGTMSQAAVEHNMTMRSKQRSRLLKPT